MKRFSIIIVFSFCYLFLAMPVQAEVIDNFSADYTITADSVVNVSETIDYDFESADKHGIFRTLLKKHPQAGSSFWKERFVDIQIISVKRDGVAEPFTVTEGRSSLEIKVGDKDVTRSGKHAYQIRYQLRGAVSYTDTTTEFYWNVTGNNWTVPITRSSAVVRSEFLKGNYTCYYGLSGSVDNCQNANSGLGDITFTQDNLAVGEGLTVAVELDKGNIAFMSTERPAYIILGCLVLLGIFVYYLVWTIKLFNKNKIKKPVIAQYEPYKNYLPMYTGMLFDNKLDPQDLTAGILYLAEQGFIKLIRTDKKVLFLIPVTDYTIELTKSLAEVPTVFLSRLMSLLFDSNSLIGERVLLSSLATKKVQNSQIITKLQSALREDFQASNFYSVFDKELSASVLHTSLISIVLLVPFVLVAGGFVLLVIAVILLIVFALVLLMSHRTVLGYETQNHIQGFKLFLSVTDKERFDFFNAPEKSPELFMKYLPYAVALGVETKWAKVFEGITIPTPAWYDGGSVSTFSAGALTSDLASFSSGFASSSGANASSGGGSSGGGGGGGGGGSW